MRSRKFLASLAGSLEKSQVHYRWQDKGGSQNKLLSSRVRQVLLQHMQRRRLQHKHFRVLQVRRPLLGQTHSVHRATHLHITLTLVLRVLRVHRVLWRGGDRVLCKITIFFGFSLTDHNGHPPWSSNPFEPLAARVCTGGVNTTLHFSKSTA